MSNAFAYAAPAARPRQEPDHIRIVTTKGQRRARPRAVYALVTVIGLFGVFMGQLLMSIVTSDGAYQISRLQSQQRALSQEEQALGEQLALLGSQQNLAAQAESLGMVLGSTTPVFLRLSDGAIVGTAVPDGDGAGAMHEAGSLVPNALLVDVPLVDPAAGTENGPTAPLTATAGSATTAQSTPGMLPSPVTR